MSKPVFEDLFKFSGRRNRQSYLLAQLASFGTIIATGLISMWLIAAAGDGGLIAGLIFIIAAIIIVASVVAAWATSAQRCRDIGWPGWVCLAQLIPYVGCVASLVILIAVGDTLVDNKYGPSQITPQPATTN